jgi:hypothetical protein
VLQPIQKAERAIYIFKVELQRIIHTYPTHSLRK